MNVTSIIPESLITAIGNVIQQAREQVRQTVNQQMVQAYWHIGRLIVEQEQQGKEHAEYGKRQLEQLSSKLSANFGKGFDVTNLRNMRRFYQLYPIRDAVRPNFCAGRSRELPVANRGPGTLVRATVLCAG